MTGRTVFVDTSFFVAMLDIRDALHERALSLADRLDAERTHMVTTDAVVLELCNYFARSPLRRHAIDWVAALREGDGWEILGATRSLMLRGEKLYREFRDKTWSLTDCLSMEVMRARGISRVATTDVHFEQAGFYALMRP